MTLAPLVFWHGSHRWDGQPEVRAAKKGSAVHGVGIYLTTSAATARQYAKGGGAVIRFELEPGTRWLDELYLPESELAAWVNSRPRLRHRKEILADLRFASERMKGRPLPAGMLNNLLVNYEALTGDHGPELARFYVQHGADADVVKDTSAETWILLFNPERVLSWRRVPAGEAHDVVFRRGAR